MLGSICAVGMVYRSRLRRSILNWGATAAEAESRLPGDELLEGADGVATRAITIEAPASAVWPWIAQMGPSPRGGAYLVAKVGMVPMEPASLVMERKMLCGIKQRAERLYVEQKAERA